MSSNTHIIDLEKADTSAVTESHIPSSSATNDGVALKRSTAANKDKSVDKIDSKSRKVKRLRKKVSQDHGPLIKYGSLVLLIAQLVGLVLLMRYTRTHPSGEDMYLSSTAVFCMEAIKFITCNSVVLGQVGSPKVYIAEIKTHVWNAPLELLKVSVPSFLYVVQNNLLYLALSNLDAATYQVCYQLKILTTALFSATMLNRKFSRTKWLALIILTCGVAIVQTSGDSTVAVKESDSQNRSMGIIAILCAACTSGFSGVYFEKILKGSSTSLWIRNIQMGLPSVFISFFGAYFHDGATIAAKGFFVGYSPLVWTVIIVQAVGGLIVAVVMKYADNVLKTFASSISIVVSCIISAIFFDFHPSMTFVAGSCLVVLSTVMYSKPEKRAKVRRRLKKASLPTTRTG